MRLRQKGQGSAALVSKEFPSAKFVITGEGKEKASLQALVREQGILEKVEFRLWVKDVFAQMLTYDIYVLPSHREGLPITLLEAMAVGRPSVASDIEGVRDVIEDGVSGILVNTADTGAFAEAILSLCRDSQKARVMGEKALKRAHVYFSIEREMSRMRELYREIARGEVR